MLLAPLPLLSSGSQVEVQLLLGVHRLFFLKQPFQEGIHTDSPWGENSLGFPSQYPRDSIIGSIIYCCTEGHSNAQWLTTITIFISHDLESQEFGKGSVGWFWQSARCWLKSLGSIQLGWSCLVPWQGWMEGWTLLRTPTRVSTHVLSSLVVLVWSDFFLHGGSGSRRPRQRLPLLSKAKPGTSALPLLVKAVTRQSTCKGKNVEALMPISNLF